VIYILPVYKVEFVKYSVIGIASSSQNVNF